MRTRIHDRRLLIAPIGFALVAVLLSVLAWRSFGGPVPIAPESYGFSVVVPQASNLQAGAAVRSAGVDVGEVTGVTRDGGGARISVALEPQFAPLHTDAHLIIRSKSLLGEAYVQLTLGTRDLPLVSDGGELPPANVVASQRLDDVLSIFNPATRDDMRRFVRGFAGAVKNRSLDLSDAVGYGEPATRELAQLARLADGQRDDIGRLIQEGGGVLKQVGEDDGATRALILEGRKLFDVTAARNDDLTAIVRALPEFLAEARRTSSSVTGATPELRSAITALEPAAPLLKPAVSSTKRALPQARSLFRRLPATIRTSRRGLPALASTVEQLRPAIAEIYPVLREIVPIVQFAAEDPTFLTGTAANLTSIGNFYVPGPNGTRQHYGRAVPMLWNEIAAGFKEALPTSRQNQYPEPGSLDRIGKKPPLAWSCSNLDNPQVVPVIPLGTGAPPCKVQGPYEFNGKKAYYPRLERATP